MTPDTNTLIGRRMRFRRQVLGLKQKEVAAQVGVAFQQVQKYECGLNTISASRLWQIANALQVPIGYFFGEQNHVIRLETVEQLGSFQ